MKSNLSCAAPSRRRLLTLAALGGGATLMGLPRAARAAGSTEALLLTCMDYRLMDDVTRYMTGRGMADKYDQVVLAGASLGALTEKQPAWGETFWSHVKIALDLHHIHRIIVIDHRDCGAYKVFLGEAHLKDAASETATHAGYLRRLREAISARHPKLETELFLMALDGSVEAVA
jgi:carbonic anhydrase